MNSFKATLTDCDGFKKNIIINLEYQYYNYDYEVFDHIRQYVNLHYSNWKFLDFEISGRKYTMLNDPNNGVICTCRYYYSNCFTTIFTYINNGRDLINHIVIQKVLIMQVFVYTIDGGFYTEYLHDSCTTDGVRSYVTAKYGSGVFDSRPDWEFASYNTCTDAELISTTVVNNEQEEVSVIVKTHDPLEQYETVSDVQIFFQRMWYKLLTWLKN